MLFSIRADDFESEKERNLYYKFFAGYFFNELIPDVETRLSSFCTLLNNCTRGGKSISSTLIKLTHNGTHISFDNHVYLFSEIKIDRGEFADILIQDRSTRVFIPIEAKVHSDWSYDKDIIGNERRLRLIEEEIPNLLIFPCLLVKQSKWEASARQDSREHSNYRHLMEADDCRTRVIFWEELLHLIDDDRIIAFVEDQLARPERNSSYTFNDDWFVSNYRN